MPLPERDESEWALANGVSLTLDPDEKGIERVCRVGNGLANLNFRLVRSEQGDFYDLLIDLVVNESPLHVTSRVAEAMVKRDEKEKYVVRATQIAILVTDLTGAEWAIGPRYTQHLDQKSAEVLWSLESAKGASGGIDVGLSGESKGLFSRLTERFKLPFGVKGSVTAKVDQRRLATFRESVMVVQPVENGWIVGHSIYGDPKNGYPPGRLKGQYFQSYSPGEAAPKATVAARLDPTPNADKVGMSIHVFLTQPLVVKQGEEKHSSTGEDVARQFMRERLAGMALAKSVHGRHAVTDAAFSAGLPADHLWLGRVSRVTHLYDREAPTQPEPDPKAANPAQRPGRIKRR